MWKCEVCSEEIEDKFNECWNCAANNISEEEKNLITSFDKIENEIPLFDEIGNIIRRFSRRNPDTFCL